MEQKTEENLCLFYGTLSVPLGEVTSSNVMGMLS